MLKQKDTRRRFKTFFIVGLFLTFATFLASLAFLNFYVLESQESKNTLQVDKPAPFLLNCDANYLTPLPVTTGVVVPIYMRTFARMLPLEEQIKYLVYEQLIRNHSNLFPYNYLVASGKIQRFYCDKNDFVFKGLEGLPKGAVVIGVLDFNEKTQDALKQLVDEYKLSRLLQGKIEYTQKEEARKVPVLRLDGECRFDICEGIKLYENGLALREYTVKLLKVEYPKEVINPSEVSIKVVVENTSGYVIPDASTLALTIKEVSNNPIPDLYSESWESLKRVVTLNETAIPASSKISKEFKVGPFLKPATLSSTFAVFIGDQEIPNTRFTVTITFKKGDYKLGVIYSDQYSFANVRSAPSFDSEVLFKLDVGDYVIWQKQEGAWVYIKTVDGREGWVYRRLIREYRVSE